AWQASSHPPNRLIRLSTARPVLPTTRNIPCASRQPTPSSRRNPLFLLLPRMECVVRRRYRAPALSARLPTV
ncbi:MAG: hypothetical protein WCK89_22110, partial [bacterium]